MPSALAVKKKVKENLLVAVDKAGELDLSKTISEICLNTGFTRKTINEIIEQMTELRYITVEYGVIRRPKKNG